MECLNYGLVVYVSYVSQKLENINNNDAYIMYNSPWCQCFVTVGRLKNDIKGY